MCSQRITDHALSNGVRLMKSDSLALQAWQRAGSLWLKACMPRRQNRVSFRKVHVLEVLEKIRDSREHPACVNKIRPFSRDHFEILD